MPAAELSFWDLFPEDLPPARPGTAAVEDVLVDHLALPEGPESNVGRIIASPSEEEADAPSATPPPPPEAEMVIAELLDGPPPTGLRTSPDSQWAPPPDDDFVLSDLLASQENAADDVWDANGDDVVEGDDAGPPPEAPARLGRDEQARIAADRARRRRSRRSGRRKQPGSG